MFCCILHVTTKAKNCIWYLSMLITKMRQKLYFYFANGNTSNIESEKIIYYHRN